MHSKRIVEYSILMIVLLSYFSINVFATEAEAPTSDDSGTYSTYSENYEEDTNKEITGEELNSYITKYPAEDAIEVPKTEEANTDVNKYADVIGLASMVVTWSGFVLAVFAGAVAILGFFGIREINDIRKSLDDTQALKQQLGNSIGEINTIKKTTQDEFSSIIDKLNNATNTILQATFYYTRGVDQYYAGNYTVAIQYLEKSICYLPDNTDAICLLGRAYTFVNKKEQSLSCYNKALEINPKCAAAYRGLAAYYRLTDLEKSIESIKTAVSYAPNDVEILSYQGQLLKEKGDIDEALEIFKKADGIQHHPITDYNLCILYLEKKEYERARFHLLDSLARYNQAYKYGGFKPVWKLLAEWVQILISDEENKLQKAKIKLYDVEKAIDSDRTRVYVVRNINDVLKVLETEQSYIEESNRIIRK